MRMIIKTTEENSYYARTTQLQRAISNAADAFRKGYGLKATECVLSTLKMTPAEAEAFVAEEMGVSAFYDIWLSFLGDAKEHTK